MLHFYCFDRSFLVSLSRSLLHVLRVAYRKQYGSGTSVARSIHHRPYLAYACRLTSMLTILEWCTAPVICCSRHYSDRHHQCAYGRSHRLSYCSWTLKKKQIPLTQFPPPISCDRWRNNVVIGLLIRSDTRYVRPIFDFSSATPHHRKLYQNLYNIHSFVQHQRE